MGHETVMYILSGFCVGALVGMTGVGGGSLMTPILILLFGVHPVTAVGTDLLYAAATKMGGTLAHGISGTIRWVVVRRLAMGSVPATVITLFILSRVPISGTTGDHLISVVLGIALVLTAIGLVFRDQIVGRFGQRMAGFSERRTMGLTIATGAVLGVLVSISSVGAGALGSMALILLYPRLPMAEIVGSDIAHAVPLTLLAGLGHWMIGSVDFHIVGVLLLGSLPGIAIGSIFAVKAPGRVIQLALAAILVVVGGHMVL